ncbi:hypothetical protein VTI28DRAFT_2346 [Corynascus sepedonium]
MATRQERMRDRMRGAGRHNVGDIDFGFIIPVAEDLPAVEPSPPPPAPAAQESPAPTTQAPASSHDVYSIPDASTEAGETATALEPPSPTRSQSSSLPRSTQPPLRQQSQQGQNTEADIEDHPMVDAPLFPSNITSTQRQQQQQQQQQQRGPLSSVISATKRLSFDPSSSSPLPRGRATTPTAARTRIQTQQQPQPQPQQQLPAEEMEVTESPADAPGSGRRRPLRLGASTPVVGSSTLLQKVVGGDQGSGEEGEGEGKQQHGNSSPIERRLAARRQSRKRSEQEGRKTTGRGAQSRARTRGGTEGQSVGSGLRVPLGEPAQSRGTLGGGGPQSGMRGFEERDRVAEEEEVAETVENSVVQPEEGEEEEVQEVEEQEEEEAQEVGEEEVAQRLGRKRPRRSLPAPSPELDSGTTEQSLPKRRRRREAASPAQQQQPAKKARVGRPAKPQQPRPSSPSPQPEAPTLAQPRSKPKPKAKKQPRRSRDADDEDEEGPSGSVPVTVQRFNKPAKAPDGAEAEDEPSTNALSGEIPYANRGGVNAVDVLSKLCEELIEAYMDKLEERGRAAEDAATRREQKTMYRALEAFQEELRTRFLEHTVALDTLHSLRKRVRAAQKERLGLRDEILRIRAEREQVALRMDAIRIRHEADSKEALRHISLSSAMHDIDMAVERGLAAPELSPAEQKKADLANLELLIGRVADQACTRSDGGGTLGQIKEFNAFLERAAAVLEGR